MAAVDDKDDDQHEFEFEEGVEVLNDYPDDEEEAHQLGLIVEKDELYDGAWRTALAWLFYLRRRSESEFRMIVVFPFSRGI